MSYFPIGCSPAIPTSSSEIPTLSRFPAAHPDWLPDRPLELDPMGAAPTTARLSSQRQPLRRSLLSYLLGAVARKQLHLIGLLAPSSDVERRLASRISRVNVGAELHENRHHVPALGLGG